MSGADAAARVIVGGSVDLSTIRSKSRNVDGSECAGITLPNAVPFRLAARLSS